MKNTIKSLNGYSVKTASGHYTNNPNKTVKIGKVYDGDKLLFVAEIREKADYLDDMENNECAYACEVFTTTKGNQFVLWGDYEVAEHYLTKIKEAKKQ
jgi:hypothetical protein